MCLVLYDGYNKYRCIVFSTKVCRAMRISLQTVRLGRITGIGKQRIGTNVVLVVGMVDWWKSLIYGIRLGKFSPDVRWIGGMVFHLRRGLSCYYKPCVQNFLLNVREKWKETEMEFWLWKTVFHWNVDKWKGFPRF